MPLRSLSSAHLADTAPCFVWGPASARTSPSFLVYFPACSDSPAGKEENDIGGGNTINEHEGSPISHEGSASLDSQDTWSTDDYAELEAHTETNDNPSCQAQLSRCSTAYIFNGKGKTITLRAAHSWPAGSHITRGFWSTDGQRMLLDLDCNQHQPSCSTEASSSHVSTDQLQAAQPLWQLLDAIDGTPIGSMSRELWDGMVPVQQPGTNSILVQAGAGQLAILDLVSLSMAPPSLSLGGPLQALRGSWWERMRLMVGAEMNLTLRQACYTSDGAWVAVLLDAKTAPGSEPITGVLIAGCQGQSVDESDWHMLGQEQAFSSMSWSPKTSRPELALVSVVSINPLLSPDTNGLQHASESLFPCGRGRRAASLDLPVIVLHRRVSHLVTWPADGRFLALLSKDLKARTPIYDRLSYSDSWLKSPALVSFPMASSAAPPAEVSAERAQLHLRDESFRPTGGLDHRHAWALYVPHDMHQVLASHSHVDGALEIACGISLQHGQPESTHASGLFHLEDVHDGAWADWTSQQASTIDDLCKGYKVAAPQNVRQMLSIAWVPAHPRCTPAYARLLKAAQPAAAWDGVVNLCLVDGIRHSVYAKASLRDLELLSQRFNEASEVHLDPLSKFLSVHWSPHGGTLVAEFVNGFYVLSFASQHS